ncbi:hypothetical protein [Streptomyces griseocarneus]|uniref:hypothetical protein n=1 Tax=Streptomyces griseocarneus TaxID=51201 RepID=UPI00167E4BBF|nr:hypothetical protein [Streptomyces griseocarneus]MBZ6475746.1 hypothetical protein [Streptomyces griseocarneus]GHG51003.1 hypothetical protein GCM10018779_11600 [Streptomyces griseocarneus]
MDPESAIDELFRLRPEEFTAARDRRAAQARRDGDLELARRLKALRRPTLAAWASNLLVRALPDEAEALTALGEGLRAAHRDLDGGRLRELGRRQRALVVSLSAQASRLAEEAGHPVGEDVRREVEETLHAVLADPGTAREWAAGRLTRPPAPATGFPGLTPDAAERLAAPPSPAPAGPSRERGPGARVTDLAAERARRQAKQHGEELTLARRQAREARKESHTREEELGRARDEADRAERAERDAQRQLEELAAELAEAEDRRRAAHERVREIQNRVRAAERAWRSARRAAEAAEAEAERLT